MKILIIKGSPHKNGSSNTLAGEFIRGAKEAGHEITEFDAGNANVHPCMGCSHCGMDGDCVFKDDMLKAKSLIMDADMLVFVTPVYYFGMSAQLKALIDRFYSFTTHLSDAHKKAVLITAAWDSDEDVMPYIQAHYDKLCRYMNFQNMGMVLGLGCGRPHITEQTEYPQKAYELGRAL